MIIRRGDVLLGLFLHADGTGSSRRPMLVVQCDRFNLSLQNYVIAQITSNLSRRGDPANLLIDANHPDWVPSGLIKDSLVSCHNLYTIHRSRIDRKIGSLSDGTMRQIDECLKAALGIS